MSSDLPMAGLPAETLRARAERLEHAAKLLRAVADDADAEFMRAYERWKDADARAEYAEHEAEVAFAAFERSLEKTAE